MSNGVTDYGRLGRLNRYRETYLQVWFILILDLLLILIYASFAPADVRGLIEGVLMWGMFIWASS